MTFRLVKKAPMYVVGIAARTSNADLKEVPVLWNQFYTDNISAQIPNKKSNEIVALYTDYEKDYSKPFTYLVGYEVTSLDDIPTGLVGKTVPASTYAVFSAKGDFPQNVISAWTTVWKTDLNRRYKGDLEIFTEKFQKKETTDVDIYISIKDL